MNFNFQPEKVGTQSPGVVAISGQFLTTTGGTISGVPNIPGGGASIAKTAATTGRYTITLTPPAGVGLANFIFLGGFATVIGPDTGALTTTKGLVAVFRRDDISQTSIRGTSAKDGTIELQFVQTNAGNADTEVEDGAAVCFTIFVGSVNVQ